MDKKIEEAFFSAFQKLADGCISLMLHGAIGQLKAPLQQQYKMHYLEGCKGVDELKSALERDFRQYKKTAKRQEDISVEIGSNIDSIADDRDRAGYIVYLFAPFKGLCRIMHPTWQKAKDETCNTDTPWQRQERLVNAFQTEIEDNKYHLISRYAQANNYHQLSYVFAKSYKPIEEGTLEYYLHHILMDMAEYSNRLFAVLVQRGIDPNHFQEYTGIYLKATLTAKDIAPYIGNEETAQYYIRSIKAGRHPQLPIAQQIPAELNSEKAQVYFAKAIELGLMDKDYKWLNTLEALATFAHDMSNELGLSKRQDKDGNPQISWKPFEELFIIPKGKLRKNYDNLEQQSRDCKDINLIHQVFEN